MKTIIIAAAGAAFSAATVNALVPIPASSQTYPNAATRAFMHSGRCLVRVDGVTYQDGPCRYNDEPNSDGSASVLIGQDMSLDAYYGPCAAFVDEQSNGEWEASWNKCGGLNADANVPLYPNMKKAGACWTNSRAKFCLWK